MTRTAAALVGTWAPPVTLRPLGVQRSYCWLSVVTVLAERLTSVHPPHLQPHFGRSEQILQSCSVTSGRKSLDTAPQNFK